MQKFTILERSPPCGEIVLAHTASTCFRARWDGVDWANLPGYILHGVTTWSPISTEPPESALFPQPPGAEGMMHAPAAAEKTYPTTTDLVRHMVERRELEGQHAYDNARTIIECYCSHVADAAERDGSDWYNTTPCTIPQDDRLSVYRAARYLDLCGLIERSPDDRHIVRVKDRPVSAVE